MNTVPDQYILKRTCSWRAPCKEHKPAPRTSRRRPDEADRSTSPERSHRPENNTMTECCINNMNTDLITVVIKIKHYISLANKGDLLLKLKHGRNISDYLIIK